MKVNAIKWVSSRGFINSCNEYTAKNGKNVRVLRFPHEDGSLIKRYDTNKNGIIEKIVSYLNVRGKVTKTIEK